MTKEGKELETILLESIPMYTAKQTLSNELIRGTFEAIRETTGVNFRVVNKDEQKAIFETVMKELDNVLKTRTCKPTISIN